jgi:hypothetical protein
VLPNGEKVAEILGHLAKVQGSYNPKTHQLTFSPNIDLLQFNQNYEARSDQAFLDQGGADTHFYMRVWDRGSDTMSPASVLIQAGANVLGDTGLELRFTGNDRVPGDFWIIAARPETPQEVLPWRLRTNGMKPFGHRRYFAPLAVVKWTLPFASETINGEIIHDCRKTFRPLTDLETCCTFHVGDGKHSFGDFNSLAEALANLPDTGGKICMLPGRHYANVEIAYKSHITICGCGDQSILFTEEGRAADPTITIRHCDNITIEGLSFVARRNRAIYLSDMEADLDIASNTIIIRRNYFVAGGNAIYIHTQSDVAGDNNIYIGYNEIAIPNVDTAGVGIFCLADGVCIAHNRVLVVPDPQDDRFTPVDDNGDALPEPNPCDMTPQEEEDLDIIYFWAIWDLIHNLFGWSDENPYLALGGIQIGGSSERVRLLDNVIVGGASNGITLGHMPSDLDTIGLALVPHPRWDEFHRTAMTTGDFDLGTLVLGELGPWLGHFKPALYGITIERNEIRDMGLAGVGTICFFKQTTVLQDIVVIVNDLQLRDNKIVHCAQQIPSITRNSMFVGYGGVVMAVLERGAILDNLIQDCGKRSAEPICGIYIMSGDKLEISRNRILNNGPAENLGLPPGSANPFPTRLGTRGGIFIASLTKADILDVFLSEGIRNGLPAAKIQDNIVVQPLGQALFVIALGPVSVLGNNFTTQDQDITNELSINAATVYILNLGVSNDQLRVNFEPTLSQLSHLPSGLLTANNPVYTVGLILEGFLYLPSGQVMFNNNQVTFDQRNLETDATLSSVSIITSDDVSFCANQLECLGLGTVYDEELGIVSISDFVVTDALLVGMTVRTADNRFQEGFTGTTWSLVSAAYANTTTGNQSSKCLNAFGTREQFANNIKSLLDDNECQRNRGALGRSTGLLFGS